MLSPKRKLSFWGLTRPPPLPLAQPQPHEDLGRQGPNSFYFAVVWEILFFFLKICFWAVRAESLFLIPLCALLLRQVGNFGKIQFL